MPAEQDTIERVQAFWNRQPCNIQHSPRPVGSRDYFDEVEARKYFLEPHIPAFAQFGRWRGRKVLEIGAGLGTDAVNFARTGADVTVVELSKRSLELCRKRFEIYGLRGQFYAGNAEELSRFVPIETYDLVYSFGALHHTPSPARVLAEIRKYMGPDSELRVMLYAKWSWKVLWIVLRYGYRGFWRLDRLIAEHSEAQFGSPVTATYSLREVRRLFREFTIQELRKEHIVVERWSTPGRDRLWYFCWMPKEMLRWLEHRMGWHTLVVARR